MNKVFSCADDCEIKIYYKDTDSIHLNYDDVPNVLRDIKKTTGQS